MLVRRASIVVLLLAGMAAAQSSMTSASAAPPTDPAKPSLVIPGGTRVPLSLKQAISTKTAKDGDPAYAETAFPLVLNDRVVIPAGSYIKGKTRRVQRGGDAKARAELLIHSTSTSSPSAHTLVLDRAA